jgi:hypothetical protein
MEPNAEKTPALALPRPGDGQMASEAAPGYHSREAVAAHPESAPSPSAPPPMAGAAPIAMPQPGSPAVMLQNAPQSQAANAAVDDMTTDALDEEWINKAKAIIEQTKNDPYIESREISKAKADYLRIRYNKHVKVAEDTTR